MKLLLLGGTEFVGRAIAEEALARDWDVTVFHRGRHPAPPGVTALYGDRTEDGGAKALADGEWDAVVDTWSHAPAAVRDTARLLADRAGHYTYISSRSVHPDPVPYGTAEDGPLVDGSADDTAYDDYAQAKRGGELAATAAFGDRALLARAGLVLGPYENVGRLPYWLLRIARGGTVPAPGPRELPLQYIDVRDLARWVVDASAQGLGGPYNLVSTPGHATMAELLDACVRVTGSDARLHWVTPEAVEQAGVQPWEDLPVWLPPGDPAHGSIFGADVSKALATGLRCRPVDETVAGTWAWLRSLDGPPPQRSDRARKGLSTEQEAALLSAG